ncbi:tripartite tricarboxylate transporter substrate binding protein [Vineibacter terrae]|uniref:Tripartite tricarboxylate transporter substrate binding protein n=1 Tax=Vineibacter terrae TaxID=2586908 RepID=A0A5C8PRY8_9HYPH|nr:tripartite tricarboxylate transporter substrate binding protein [Vineibacter terrae]TXL77682.1 tripartite tricarboxylate transporter substrate binding protein [Vineibacter terrae]
MKIIRWLAGFAAVASLLAAAGPGAAQPWPSKPIRLVVPYAAGSGSDIVARIVADPLSRALGQPIVVDNKPGANSTVGTEAVVTSPPDGYTLGLMTNAGLVASPAGLTGGVRYDPAKDLGYATMVGSVTYVWVVNTDVAARTAPELIRLIKASPGKFNYASGNTGGIAYGGTIKNTYQLDMTHVPYKSVPPALVDLIAGNVQVMVADVAASLAMIRSGKVRAIGVPTAQRNPLLPDVPTFAESGLATPPDMSGWWVLVAPAGTPDPILDRLNQEVVRILNTGTVRSALLQAGIVPTPSTRQHAVQYQEEQLQVWRAIVKDLNLKAE